MKISFNLGSNIYKIIHFLYENEKNYYEIIYININFIY